MEENKAQAKAAQEKHDELMRELGESKQTVAAVQSKVPFVSYPRIVMKAYMGVMQIDRLLSSLVSLCAQVGELEKENQGLRATLELARAANTRWSGSWGKQDKELQCRQAEIEKLKVGLAKVRGKFSSHTPNLCHSICTESIGAGRGTRQGACFRSPKRVPKG